MHFESGKRGPDSTILNLYFFIIFLYYLSLQLLYAVCGSLSNYPLYSLTILTYFQAFVSLCHVLGELPGVYVSVLFMTVSGLAFIQSTRFFFLISGQGLHFLFPRFQINSFPYPSFLKVPFCLFLFHNFKKNLISLI